MDSSRERARDSSRARALEARVSTLFDAALAALERALGPGTASHAVERCELARDGRLWIHTRVHGTRRWFAHDGAALTERVPADERELPALAELLDARGTALDIVAWRPGRRLVAFDARAGAGSPPLVHKLVRAGRGGAARERHEVAQFAAAGAFAVPRLQPRHAATSADALAFTFVAGRELDLARDAERCAEIGRGLARFQRGAESASLAAHTRADELAVLDRAAERWNLAVGELPESWRGVRTALEGAAHADGRSVLAHRDLHDGQFLVDGHTLALLDFDLLARAEPELDVANLLEHLALCERQSVRGANSARVRAAQAALLGGLGAAGVELDPAALAFYRATTALRLALVHGLRPRWHSLAEPLSAHAARFLVEL